MENKRYLYLDVLKCLACFLVIYNHTNNRGFYLYALDNINSPEFVYDYFLAMFSKIAVPIFFMISGTTLLIKDENIKATFRRIPRIFIALTIFYFLYYYIDLVHSGTVFTLKNFIQAFFNKNWWHLWYLNAYIVFLISLPVFRKFVKGIDKPTGIYFIAMAFVWMCVFPIVSFFLTSINTFKCPWIVCGFFAFPFIGYILAHVFDTKKLNISHIKTLWGINLIFYILGLACEYKYLSTPPPRIHRLAEQRALYRSVLFS